MSAARLESRALPPEWGPRKLPVPAAFPDTYPGLGAEITFIERFALKPSGDGLLSVLISFESLKM
jgi:hypothetical protein